MSGERWRFVREREDDNGRLVRLEVCEFSGEGKPKRFRRTTERSRAGVDPKDRRGPAWCLVEYCHRLEGGELSPWLQAWEWSRDSFPPPGEKLGTGPAM